MEVVVLCFGLLSFFDLANTQTDNTHQNLQFHDISLQSVVQKLVTEFEVLQQEHKELERKYSTLLVDLSFLRHKQDRTVSHEVNENGDPVGQVDNHLFSRTRKSVLNEQTNPLCECLTGDKGDTGMSGPRGYNGTDGINGQKGDRGLKGDPGIAGFNGDDGIDGIDGEKGDRGIKGDAGAIGPPGHKGDAGTTGPQGPKGDEGMPGTRGTAGHKGQKGEPSQNAVGNLGTQIAFSARVELHPYIHDSIPIIFDAESLNVGGAYNKGTGRFTCIVAGIYVFTWTTEAGRSRHIKSQLRVNSQNRAHLEVSAGIYPNSGSATIVFHLNIADVVDVTSLGSSQGAFLGQSSSFSGHLLYST